MFDFCNMIDEMMMIMHWLGNSITHHCLHLHGFRCVDVFITIYPTIPT